MNKSEIESCKHTCELCKKIYSSASSLWNHNNKFHNENSQQKSNTSLINIKNSQIKSEKQKIEKTYQCKFCNKIYNVKQSKWSHEKICKKKTNEIEELKNELIEQKKEIIEQKKEINELKNNKISATTTTKTNCNNTNTTNSNNATTNNNIIINNFGKENIRDLTNTEIKNLIKNKKADYLIEMLKLTNFNDRLPENHNFCITSLEGKYVSVLNPKTQQIDKINKDAFFCSMIQTSYLKFDDLFFLLEIDEEKKEALKEKYIERLTKQFEKKYNKLNYMTNIKNIKKYNSNVNALGYNHKNMVLDTWSKLPKKENNNDNLNDNISDSGSEFSDDTINSNEIEDDDS
jgi:hypothetical protein